MVMFHSYVKLPEGIGVNESWWVQTFRHGRISTAKVAASESEIDPAPRQKSHGGAGNRHFLLPLKWGKQWEHTVRKDCLPRDFGGD